MQHGFLENRPQCRTSTSKLQVPRYVNINQLYIGGWPCSGKSICCVISAANREVLGKVLPNKRGAGIKPKLPPGGATAAAAVMMFSATESMSPGLRHTDKALKMPLCAWLC